MIFLFIILIIIIGAIIATSVKIVPQAHVFIVERLGVYYDTWEAGVHFKAPYIDRIASKISKKERVVDFPPQPVITKDNVTIQVDTVVYYLVTDAKLYSYGIDNAILAIENLTATTLRNILGDLELDETLTSRDIVNTKMRTTLDEATDDWGIKVSRVELKNILPPADIQEAMEKQMRAERERREAILRAEGEKKAAILKAEGEKQSNILKAEGEKESLIKRAEGEAEAIYQVNKATAEGLKLLNASSPTQEVLTVKSLEALGTVADGKATKLIIPTELTSVTSLLSTAKTVWDADTK